MSMFIQRKLRAKFIGNEGYRPKNFSQKGFVPVIGFETRRVEKRFDDTPKIIEELFIFIIDDTGKLISCASFNFSIMVDATEESISHTSELLKNATILIKQLAERMYPQPGRDEKK